MIYLRLFWEFFKAGLFSIGGGLATLPFLYDMAGRTGWFTAADVADMLAIAESTPGPMGVNMATYTGFSVAGLAGSVCATLGLVAPGVAVILVIAAFLARFHENRYVLGAFYGLRPASVALITGAGVSVAVEALFVTEGYETLLGLFNWPAIALCAVLLVATKKLEKLHPIVFIAFSALVGAVFRFAGA